jgi:hypothetical protein
MPEEAVERNRRIEIAGDSWLFAGFRVSQFQGFNDLHSDLHSIGAQMSSKL